MLNRLRIRLCFYESDGRTIKDQVLFNGNEDETFEDIQKRVDAYLKSIYE